MIILLFYLQIFGIASANFKILNSFLERISPQDTEEERFSRLQRAVKSNEYNLPSPTCDQLTRTALTPFVVLLLAKTSGRFLGMGSIIDKHTVLTASLVVEKSFRHPKDLLVLAGRLGPYWGTHSQVKEARDIFANDAGLALVKLSDPLDFNKNVSPIRLPNKVETTPAEFQERYGDVFAVFGVPRSSWDTPGDYAPKGSTYHMKVESTVPENLQADCISRFPGLIYNDTVNFCTTANGTYCWGCIGSPTVGIDDASKVLQVATVTKTTTTDQDDYHVHTKISPFDQWIASQSDVTWGREGKS